MKTDSTSASAAYTEHSCFVDNADFDPADWLARYTALGGVYAANGELNLCVLVGHQSEDDLSQIRQMIVDLNDDDKAAILAHLKTTDAGPPPSWQDLIARYEATEAAFSNHAYSRTLPDDPQYETLNREHQLLMQVSTAALHQVVTAPAPDHAALGRKIQIVQKEYGDSGGLLAAISADVARLGSARFPVNADEAIFAAWGGRRAAYSQYNALPFSDKEGVDYTPEEQACWDTIEAAEQVIQEAVAASPGGVAIQLWTALRHEVTTRQEEDAVHRMDLAALVAAFKGRDWNVCLILAAIKSLSAMEAARG